MCLLDRWPVFLVSYLSFSPLAPPPLTFCHPFLGPLLVLSKKLKGQRAKAPNGTGPHAPPSVEELQSEASTALQNGISGLAAGNESWVSEQLLYMICRCTVIHWMENPSIA